MINNVRKVAQPMLTSSRKSSANSNKSSVLLNPEAPTLLKKNVVRIQTTSLSRHASLQKEGPSQLCLLPRKPSTSEKIWTSYVMTHILSYLTPSDQIKNQGLNRFFYCTQARAFAPVFPVVNQKYRLHLLNQDYLLVFNFDDMSKHKYIINNFQQLWNH